MSKEHKISDIYEFLRNAGFKLETQLNEQIRNHLNRRDVAGIAGILANHHANLIERLHQYQEITSIQLNIPTKKDVANIGKLTIQTEEKVDKLRDEIMQLAASIEELKALLAKNGISDSTQQQSVPLLMSDEETTYSSKSNKKRIIYELTKSIMDPSFASLLDPSFALGKNELHQAVRKLGDRHA
ncbi:hypothetical protein [Neobacillus terrae]|uniref:hypothetical protein n=1 Tax=Neobacillus terrae TaxID=3034837 RepID=UPI00140D2DCA|nr:hypothetical protein [Neobacillus terrae]NHM31943.1 hypothetical protein [Neobacillus terrae]